MASISPAATRSAGWPRKRTSPTELATTVTRTRAYVKWRGSIDAASRPAVRCRRSRRRSVRAVMSTAVKVAGRKRLAAIVAVLLVVGVVVATVGAGRQRAAARRGRTPPRRRGGRWRLGGAHHDEGASGDRRDRDPGRSRRVDRQRDQRGGLPHHLGRRTHRRRSSSPSPSRSTHWAPRLARSSRARPRARRCRPPPEASCS